MGRRTVRPRSYVTDGSIFSNKGIVIGSPVVLEKWFAAYPQAVCHVENLGWAIRPPCIFVVVLQKMAKPPARKLGRPLRDIFLRGVSSPLAAELGE